MVEGDAPRTRFPFFCFLSAQPFTIITHSLLDPLRTMQITLRKGLREYEFRAPFTTGHGDALRFSGVAQAHQFLRGFHGDSHSTQAFRRLLDGRAGRDHCRAWADQKILEELARWLVHGKLGVTSRRLPVMDSVDPVEEPKPAKVPFAPRARPVPKPEQKKAPPPPEPDLARQAETLKAAAEDGTPLCEECTSKDKPAAAPPRPGPDPKTQADTLKRAAKAGSAFCEECTKKQAEETRERA